jgi:hypothetical protein
MVAVRPVTWPKVTIRTPLSVRYDQNSNLADPSVKDPPMDNFKLCLKALMLDSFAELGTMPLTGVLRSKKKKISAPQERRSGNPHTKKRLGCNGNHLS